jgi:phosphoglycolate phosphatase
MNFSKLQAAIVDLDGTMIDTLGDFDVVLNAVLRELALPRVERAFVALTVGKGSEHLIRRTLAEVGADDALYEPAWALYQQRYLEVNGDHAVVYPGVLEGLERLRSRGWKLACLTNKPTAFARPLLQKKGLDGFFNAVFGGDAFARKKPDPLPLLKTCEALGAPAKRHSRGSGAASPIGCSTPSTTQTWISSSAARQARASSARLIGASSSTRRAAMRVLIVQLLSRRGH